MERRQFILALFTSDAARRLVDSSTRARLTERKKGSKGREGAPLIRAKDQSTGLAFVFLKGVSGFELYRCSVIQEHDLPDESIHKKRMRRGEHSSSKKVSDKVMGNGGNGLHRGKRSSSSLSLPFFYPKLRYRIGYASFTDDS